MLSSDTQDLSDTTIAAAKLIDSICDEFERQWRAGEQPRIESRLGYVEVAFRDDLLAELIATERELRANNGDSPQLAEYQSRFPQHAFAVRVAFEALGDQPPSQVGRYRMLKRIGNGNFGTVYRAHDDELHRIVAVKIANRERLRRPSDAEAYIEEARMIARLDHPGIVPVHDVGRTEDGVPYIVSKYIEGENLAERSLRQPLSFHDAAKLIASVSESLHVMHQQGLIHRDIKPSNLLLDKQGRPHLTDFGLAEQEHLIVGSQGFVGSPAYMSPEQVRADAKMVDARSDIWALGVVLYELLTADRPIKADSPTELLDRMLDVEIINPTQLNETIPDALAMICLKALAKAPEERYQSATELADALRGFIAGHANSGESDRAHRHSSWWPAYFGAASIMVLISVLVTVKFKEVRGVFTSRGDNRPQQADSGLSKSGTDEVLTAPSGTSRMFNAEEAKKFQRIWAEYVGVNTALTNSLGMTMHLIPPGDFLMGASPESINNLMRKRDDWVGDWEACIRSEANMGRVRLTSPFYLGTCEVTVGQFAEYANDTGLEWQSPKGDDAEVLPATNISWDTAVDFCRWLSDREGHAYRLPTEAEWEFACKAGRETKWCCGEDEAMLADYAWYRENSQKTPHAVGTKLPNQFGVFDMHGNVWEWCADDFVYAPSGAIMDTNGHWLRVDPVSASRDGNDYGKVFRGGACHTEALFLRSGTRSHIDRSTQHHYYGFRVAMSIRGSDQDGKHRGN